MGINSEWLSGALVGVDGFCRTPFDAAFFRKAHGGSDHFCPSQLISATSYPGFTTTVLTAGTLVMADAVGGILNLTGGGADGHGIQMQSDGEIFLPAADKHIYFEAAIQLADADDIDWFLGLASIDTNIFSTDPTDIIAFRGDDGDLNIDFQARKAGTGDQIDTGENVSNATAVRLGFMVNGITSITPYIDGVAQTVVESNIPIVEMALTWGMLDGATTANNTFGIDWWRCLQVA